MINGLLHARGALDPPPGQPRQQQNDPTPPLWRQRLPNTRRQRFAHDAIQASARWRKALGIRVSAIRRHSKQSLGSDLLLRMKNEGMAEGSRPNNVVPLLWRSCAFGLEAVGSCRISRSNQT